MTILKKPNTRPAVSIFLPPKKGTSRRTHTRTYDRDGLDSDSEDTDKQHTLAPLYGHDSLSATTRLFAAFQPFSESVKKNSVRKCNPTAGEKEQDKKSKKQPQFSREKCFPQRLTGSRRRRHFAQKGILRLRSGPQSFASIKITFHVRG